MTVKTRIKSKHYNKTKLFESKHAQYITFLFAYDILWYTTHVSSNGIKDVELGYPVDLEPWSSFVEKRKRSQIAKTRKSTESYHKYKPYSG